MKETFAYLLRENKTYIQTLYWQDKVTHEQIAIIFGCGRTSVQNLAKEIGIAGVKTSSRAPRKKKRFKIDCSFCGKPVEKSLCFKGRFANYYCNNTCRNKDLPRKKKGQFYSSVWFKCDFCGGDGRVEKNRYKRTKKHFCKPECCYKWMSQDRKGRSLRKTSMAGELNPNWRGGKSYEPYTKGFTVELKHGILERDNFSCRLCGSKEDLLCHHIDNDKTSHEPENLTTICRSCHSSYHNSKISKEVNIHGKRFNEKSYTA